MTTQSLKDSSPDKALLGSLGLPAVTDNGPVGPQTGGLQPELSEPLSTENQSEGKKKHH